MGKSTIDGRIPTTWTEVQRDLTALQAQAMARQDVSAADLKLVEQGIAKLQETDPNAANAGNYARLIGTVQNLQGIASSSTHATKATNANWAAEMADVTHLASQMGSTTTVATPNQKIFGTQVEASALPGEAALAKGTIYAVNSDPPSYAAESDSGYTLYDSAGKQTATFTKDQKPAIDLGDGQVLKLSTKGFAGSWISNTLDDYSTQERAADWKSDATGGSAAPTATPAAAQGKSINGDVHGPGPGTAYLNMPADAKALPGDLASLQKTQQVNFLKDATPPVYITSTNSEPATFGVYNEDGTKRGDDLKAPFGIGMANGSWFAAHPKGVASSWTTTDAASLGPQAKLYDLNGSGAQDTTLKAVTLEASQNAAAPTTGASQAFKKATPEEIAKLPAHEKTNAQRANVVFTLDTEPKTMLVQQHSNTSFRLYTMDGKPTSIKTPKSTNDLDNYARFDAGNKDVIALKNGNFLQLGATLMDAKVFTKAQDVPRDKNDNKFFEVASTGLVGKGDPSKFPTKEQTADKAAVVAKTPVFSGASATMDTAKNNLEGGKARTFRTVTDPDGKNAITVSVWEQPGNKENNHDVRIKDEWGKDIISTEDGKAKNESFAGLMTGEYGSVQLSNGAKFVSAKTGYFLIAGDKAINIVTGEEVDPKKVAEDEKLSGAPKKNIGTLK